MLLFPNTLCCSLYERNCVCAVTNIFTQFLPANNFCQLLRVTRKHSCNSAGNAQRSCTFEMINRGRLELVTSPNLCRYAYLALLGKIITPSHDKPNLKITQEVGAFENTLPHWGEFFQNLPQGVWILNGAAHLTPIKRVLTVDHRSKFSSFFKKIQNFYCRIWIQYMKNAFKWMAHALNWSSGSWDNPIFFEKII